MHRSDFFTEPATSYAPPLLPPDYGYSRSPMTLNPRVVGAGFIGIAFFFLIMFSVNLIGGVTLRTLGITISFATLLFMGTVTFILFIFR